MKTVRTFLIGAGAAAALALGSAALAQDAKPGDKTAGQAAGCGESHGARGMHQDRERHAMGGANHRHGHGGPQGQEKHGEHNEHK